MQYHAFLFGALIWLLVPYAEMALPGATSTLLLVCVYQTLMLSLQGSYCILYNVSLTNIINLQCSLVDQHQDRW